MPNDIHFLSWNKLTEDRLFNIVSKRVCCSGSITQETKDLRNDGLKFAQAQEEKNTMVLFQHHIFLNNMPMEARFNNGKCGI